MSIIRIKNIDATSKFGNIGSTIGGSSDRPPAAFTQLPDGWMYQQYFENNSWITRAVPPHQNRLATNDLASLGAEIPGQVIFAVDEDSDESEAADEEEAEAEAADEEEAEAADNVFTRTVVESEHHVHHILRCGDITGRTIGPLRNTMQTKDGRSHSSSIYLGNITDSTVKDICNNVN